ncbi:hypothetical protein M426DRAFT_321839 [Hypoxylon sp. CI-4A]|nr:hypothetical protein M426DRAFT_321839 [Hypoxylon sp. CI-4A]
MLTPFEEKKSGIADLMVLCFDLTSLLENVERLESRMKTDLLEQVASFGALLQRFIAHDTGCAGFESVIQVCHNLMAGVQASVQKSTTLDIEELEKEAPEWRQHLFECQNIMLLTRYFDQKTLNTSLIRTLKEGLDGICKDISYVLDEILPLVSGDPNEGTFSVQETELTTSEGRMFNDPNPYTVCSNARFSQETHWDKRIKDIKLTCCCENTDKYHGEQLYFKVLSKTLLVAEVMPGQELTWQMTLYKPITRAFILIRISKVIPKYVRKVQELAAALAFQYAKGCEATNNSMDSKETERLKCRVTSDSVHVQTMACRERFTYEKLPDRIRLEAHEAIIEPQWKPAYMQMLHYSVWPRNTIEKGKKFSPRLLPKLKPHVELIISSAPLPSLGVDKTYTILVFPNSTVTVDPQNPLTVLVSGVQCKQNSESFHCFKVELYFKQLSDSESFRAYLSTVLERLIENLAREPSSDEKIVYSQDLGALYQEPVGPHRAKASVYISTLGSNQELNSRMIVTREGSSSCVILNFADKLPEVSRKWHQTSQHSAKVTTYGCGGTLTRIFNQVNWDKLIEQGKTRDRLRTRPGASSGGAQVLRDTKYTSDAWLDKIDALRAAMKAPLGKKGKLVKVCVIDTGFNAMDPEWTKVKEFKDFVDRENDTELRDNTGHGTLSATIILSIYTDCVLYVARVFKNNDTDEKTEPQLMVQAIDWAMEKERDVDIISISAGFEEHSPVLQDAVQRAAAANKLVFAAAANHGNRRAPAFPARHELFTLCIFSTNTLDQGSSFNPEWRATAHNFALLGEDFQDRMNPNVRQSGTSMATAAAAGLAALVIDFSRHSDNQDIPRVGDIGKMLGMIAIFKSMSKRTGKLDCVDPEKLYIGAPRAGRREWIRGNISRAMLHTN